ncbi:MAG: transmembrane 220 family protein [Pseudomonadota bacterium]
MRAVNALFCLVLLLFAVVQYNDPDFLFWSILYALAALWCGLAAAMPEVLTTHGILRASFLVCLIGALVGTVYYWPTGKAWWMKDVIWNDEAVREGLGMVIITAGLLSVSITWWLREEATA